MDKYASTLSAILRYIYKFVIKVPALRKKKTTKKIESTIVQMTYL